MKKTLFLSLVLGLNLSAQALGSDDINNLAEKAQEKGRNKAAHLIVDLARARKVKIQYTKEQLYQADAQVINLSQELKKSLDEIKLNESHECFVSVAEVIESADAGGFSTAMMMAQQSYEELLKKEGITIVNMRTSTLNHMYEKIELSAKACSKQAN